jgi:endo-1,4-beta-xylanase
MKDKKPWQRNKYRIGLVAILFLLLLGGFLYSHYRVVAPDLPQPPLKKLAAQKGISLGNFAIFNHLDDKIYAGILTSQFDFALADNTPNWYFTDGGLRPSATTYNFKNMDQVVNFANSHNMPVQAHHFVWGEEKWLPKWLTGGNYDKQQLLNLIHDHIMTVGGRYRGRIAEWTVVNEAFTRSAHVSGLHDWWEDHIGDQSYIDQSFIWAHQADPNAKLILNDFDAETANATSDAIYAYMKDALTRGVPIDGIGLQMHIDGTRPPAKDQVISNMKRFAALGLGVYVTEFDVNMHDVQGSSSKRNDIEAGIYYDMMRACIESKVCHSFAYLGITDRETWYNSMGLSDPRPLMFDKSYRPKPAFYSTRAALQN